MRVKSLLSILLISARSSLIHATIRINEVADKGSSNVCNGEDWIELYNNGNFSIDLGADRYMMHDDQGFSDDSAFIFPKNAVIEANGYLLLCTKQKRIATDQEELSSLEAPDPMSPQFGISGSDTITLIQVKDGDWDASITNIGRTSSYEIADFLILPNTDDDFDVTYAMDPRSGLFNYTSTPTPGTANIMTRVLTKEERIAVHKEKLAKQDAIGRTFFNMDERGYPVPEAMDTTLDLKITMNPLDYEYIMKNQTFELYRPFQYAKLFTQDGIEVLSLDSPGRVRPKGQSGLFVATCLGTSDIPFQLDFDNVNSSQTMFGVQRAFLRHHAEDYSFAREWAYHRMLARFGLPYLRSRKVKFYINDILHGFYTLMEAPEHEYVFHRSFPDYDPDRFALFKVKSLAKGCGEYSQQDIAHAQDRIDDISTPPYAFERGEHKRPVEVHNYLAFQICRDQFVEHWYETIHPDVVLAYVRHDMDCSEMLMKEKLVERDLGTKDWDKEMKHFIEDHLGENYCDPGCTNSYLAEEVDQENFLKMFAFYAVTLSLDSPISFGNNYYLAQSGAEAYGGKGGWKLVPYDLNAREAVGCNNEVCNSRLVHWSIARPTCESLESNQLVGPLLTRPDLYAQYLGYVREFLDTIYGNETFWGEIQAHIVETGEDVKADFWSAFGAFYDDETSPTAAPWNSGQYPFLPIIKARTEDLRAQLKAIDEGSLARAPHIGVKGDNEPWETCADWRLAVPNTTMCEQGCKYEGCDIANWTVESFCDEGTGTCYHGDADEWCLGVTDGEQYPSMEESADGQATFCRLAGGIPVKTSECPAFGAMDPNMESSAGGPFSFASVLVLALSLASLVLLSV